MSKEYNIAVIPGDGTGPEVAIEGVKVLETVAEKCGFKLNFNHYNIGGEHFKATGEILPEDKGVYLFKNTDKIILNNSFDHFKK